jgi:hypothetical protein
MKNPMDAWVVCSEVDYGDKQMLNKNDRGPTTFKVNSVSPRTRRPLPLSG